MLVTRIAPSPNGYLHAGNAVNFLLTDWLARTDGRSRVHLRIDDMNLPRVAPHHLDDIFWAIEWLGITITDGPSDVAEFRARHSQLDRVEEYRGELGALATAGLVYVCTCSRTDVASRRPATPDPCGSRRLPLVPHSSALRLHTQSGPSVPAGTAAMARIGMSRADVAAEMGDLVVWRRDDLPAYHLASVVEDRRAGVNTVVRGSDLLVSSAAQLLISPALRAQALIDARFVHHPLVTDASGAKMSKRDNADSLRSIADTAGGRQRLWAAAARAADAVGIRPRP